MEKAEILERLEKIRSASNLLQAVFGVGDLIRDLKQDIEKEKPCNKAGLSLGLSAMEEDCKNL